MGVNPICDTQQCGEHTPLFYRTPGGRHKLGRFRAAAITAAARNATFRRPLATPTDSLFGALAKTAELAAHAAWTRRLNGGERPAFRPTWTLVG